MGPASFWDSQPPYVPRVGHTKHMHALGEPYTASVGLKGSRHPVHHAWRSDLVRSAAPDTPSSSARPAGHQQDWGRGTEEYRGDMGAGVEDENQLHRTMDCTVKH